MVHKAMGVLAFFRKAGMLHARWLFCGCPGFLSFYGCPGFFPGFSGFSGFFLMEASIFSG
jgi:hypothetical protein